MTVALSAGRARRGALDRDLRVLAIIDSLSLGGAENLLATLARAASGAGLELQVASIDPLVNGHGVMHAGLKASGIEPCFLGIPGLASPGAIPRLARAIRDSGCDVVHAHLEYAATLAPLAARLVGRRTVCTFHHVPHGLSPREGLKERLAVAVASRSDGVIFVSSASMDAFAARYRHGRSRWMVIHNGVDLSTFTPDPASFPDDIDIPAGVPVAALVAAMRGGKGHDRAIEAWPSVVQRLPDARLLLVGSGPDEDRLRRRARATGFGEHIVFVGARRDVSRLMRAASLIVLPSESEALPTTLIEAAACGRAVVATSVGGIPEVVVDGITGVLVAPGDVSALADAIVDLLADRRRRRAMEVAARRTAEERFDMHAWARRLRSVYEHATASPRHWTGSGHEPGR